MAVLRQFFAAATQTIFQAGVNVEFILDGALTPGYVRGCMRSEFQPWVSTWVPSRDPWEAGFSDDPALGYDRFQVLDMQAEGLAAGLWVDIMRHFTYGKFSADKYPLLVWEPSDQADFALLSSLYLAGRPHPRGLMFSINIDPARFEVFTATDRDSSDTAWNFAFPSIVNATQPHVVVVDGHTVVVYTDAQTGLTCWATREAPHRAECLTEELSLLPPLSVTAWDPARLLISDYAGRYCVFDVAAAHSGGPVRLAHAAYGTAGSSSAVIATARGCVFGACALVLLVDGGASCGAALRVNGQMACLCESCVVKRGSVAAAMDDARGLLLVVAAVADQARGRVLAWTLRLDASTGMVSEGPNLIASTVGDTPSVSIVHHDRDFFMCVQAPTVVAML
eukprot:TRINITY_DN4368_c0_g1_i6.p1 TRINITY_DN4368_c0_g1~~TRINITY_DN4368_c0_g1_i6.p1  ORF type:complete len:394 (-),score=68.85 TRINITY_DN4368_c0_g1_i6:45-1226(-)